MAMLHWTQFTANLFVRTSQKCARSSKARLKGEEEMQVKEQFSPKNPTEGYNLVQLTALVK